MVKLSTSAQFFSQLIIQYPPKDGWFLKNMQYKFELYGSGYD